MNDSSCVKLKIIVERAVRPVIAKLGRKRQMREELLAHVHGVFEDELARRGNEAAAIEAARRRFGDPAELAAELQRGVSRGQRIQLAFDRLTWKPGDSLSRAIWKHCLLAAATYVLILSEMLIVWLIPGTKFPFSAVVRIAMGAAVGTALFVFTIVWFAHRIRAALYGDLAAEHQPPSHWRRAGPYLLVSLTLFPAAAFILFWMIVGDLGGSIARLPFGCLLAPAVPALFLLIARELDKDLRYEAQWAQLDLDEPLEA